MWTGRVHTSPFCCVVFYDTYSFLPHKGSTIITHRSPLMTLTLIDLLLDHHI